MKKIRYLIAMTVLMLTACQGGNETVKSDIPVEHTSVSGEENGTEESQVEENQISESQELPLPEDVPDGNLKVMEVIPGELLELNFGEESEETTESLLVTYKEEGDMFQSDFTIVKETSQNQIVLEKECYGFFRKAYAMQSKSGQSYLYIELMRENDYCILEIFDLNKPEEVPVYVGSFGSAFYDHPVTDTESFSLYQRVYVLGTYMGYQEYAVGQDGMPVTEDMVITIANDEEYHDYSITSSRDLMVLMHQDVSSDGDGQKNQDFGEIQKEEEILPAGTIFRPRKTDGETFMEMELSDGRRCDILLERDEESYGFLINGMNEFECFEDLPYAG